MPNHKLEDALEAHRAVCQMLQFTKLSRYMERRLLNLKRMLEEEISDLSKDEHKGDAAVAS